MFTIVNLLQKQRSNAASLAINQQIGFFGDFDILHVKNNARSCPCEILHKIHYQVPGVDLVTLVSMASTGFSGVVAVAMVVFIGDGVVDLVSFLASSILSFLYCL